MTRGDFLGFGVMGAIVGAVLTIPPVAFILDPVIKTNVLGGSNVEDVWKEVGPVSEIPDEEPVVFTVEFPIIQSYGNPHIQEESGQSDERFTITNAIWLSWRHEVKVKGRQGSIGDELGESLKPDFMDQKSEGFTEEERQQLIENINVLSTWGANSGGPGRGLTTAEGHGEFSGRGNGGFTTFNGNWVGGHPPCARSGYPRGRIEEDG